MYIPFVSNSYRNYAVLHIPPAECRLIQTKERVLYLACIEIWRPDELDIYQTEYQSQYKQLSK